MIAKSMQRNGLILAAFAVVATLLVMLTARLTAEPIAREQQRELLQVLNQLLPAELHDNDLYASCRLIEHPALATQPTPMYLARQNGRPSAAALEVVAPNGYSGAIRLLVAIKWDGTVAGVRTLQHQETPGLGDKIEIRKSDWITSFNGMTVQGNDDTRWAVTRDGGVFDQFTGATITPRAVVQAVKRSVLAFKANKDEWAQQPTNCGGAA
ncbi:electron transport complex subunit RsxG [Pseudidiomarina insulisalsae]|uniref:Ion-translocating oxidoreductase complex subunit G n=1 Tax=Pseudidiomarina insulisalsae TaxID=575789 RepID=A0A432YCF1_9GAMM|nr:electron transport complex subunit RsxG [Pseudidiomarina insulisalsae]RUO58613.1 electron transport complex subunit RsxG [Pseudidiomarina insulisalsae]